jgi:thioredoxin-like negative regulator of GroEL
MNHVLRWFAIALFFLCLPMVVCAAKLDIEGRDLTAQDVRLYGGLVESGVLVKVSDGNALAAGIKDGDVVKAINGHQVHGIFDMEEILGSIRGMRFVVLIHRVERKGLLKLQELEFEIESAIDLQIQKAFTIDLGTSETSVKAGFYRERSVLLWHANKVLTYNKKLDREQIVSLLKVYSIAEHQVYRYPVSENVLETRFLSEDGLLLYLSAVKDAVKMGIVDIETGERRLEWTLELPPLRDKPYDLKLRDVNGDGIPEIYYSFDNTLTCIDGITGNVVWYRDDLKTFLMDERRLEDLDYANIVVADFSQSGVVEVSVGPLLLNAATGEKTGYLSFDPERYQGGVLECRQLIGDPIPDVITENGLLDGNSGERVWEPLRSKQFFLADLNGDQQAEMVYLLSNRKLHIHDIDSHRELYSIDLDGRDDLDIQDFNRDGFSDILVRKDNKAHLYQTNIPVDHAVVSRERGIGYAASLLDFGLRKDKFFVFARELYQGENYEACVPLFLRALSDTDEKKQRERYISIIRYLASAFMRTGQVEGALGLLRQKDGHLAREVLQDFSSEIVAYLLDRNETWQAINFLELSQEEDPLLLARCYLAVGRPEVSVKLLTEMESKPTEAQLLLGRAYVLMNQPIAARVAFKNYLKYFPTSSEGWRELGLLEAGEEKWADSEEALLICLDLDPIVGHLALSSFYLLDSPKRDVVTALAQARSAHRMEVSSRTRLQLAEALVENLEYREASRLLAQVTDPGLEFNRYEKLSQRCMYQIQAEDKYEESEKLLLSPVFKKRNFQAALDLLHEILDRYPKSLVVPMAHFRLGEVYLDPDHRDEAKAVYHFAKVMDSGHFLMDKAKDRLKVLESARTSSEASKNTLKIETTSLLPEGGQDLSEDEDEDELEDPGKSEPDLQIRPVEKGLREKRFRPVDPNQPSLEDRLRARARAAASKAGIEAQAPSPIKPKSPSLEVDSEKAFAKTPKKSSEKVIKPKTDGAKKVKFKKAPLRRQRGETEAAKSVPMLELKVGE